MINFIQWNGSESTCKGHISQLCLSFMKNQHPLNNSPALSLLRARCIVKESSTALAIDVVGIDAVDVLMALSTN